MKNLAKKEEEKEIRNIKLSAGKWFHIEAESLPESSLPKLITGMIAIRVIAGIMGIVLAMLGIAEAASVIRVWWP
jgi:hypothetical protein